MFRKVLLTWLLAVFSTVYSPTNLMAAQGLVVPGGLSALQITQSYNATTNVLSGVVVNPNGSPAGLTVSIYIDGSGVTTGTATTDSGGNWTYTLKAPPGAHSTSVSTSVSISTANGGTSTVTGTTTPTPTYGDGTAYYVSAAGSDSNNGTSSATPWLTITKVNAGTYNPGDTINFNGGDNFAGCLVFNTTNIPSSLRTHLVAVQSYGTGKATVTSNCGGAASGTNGPRTSAVKIDTVSGFMWNGVNVAGSGTTTTTQYGVLIQNNSSTNIMDMIIIENSDITGFMVPSGATSDYAAEIFVLGLSLTSTCGTLNNIQILNNTLHGSSTTSNDDSGIGGYGCGQNIFNILYQGNQIYNQGGRTTAPGGTSGNGMVANGVDGGVLQYNIVHDNGANTTACGGPGGIWDYASNNIFIQFNEVYNMRPTLTTQSSSNGGTGCDWAAYDLDTKTTNSFVQYNYSHNNSGPAWLAYTSGGGTWANNAFRFNVSENDNLLIEDGSGSASLGPTTGGLYVYNNTIYKGASAGYLTISAAPTCWSVGYNGAYGGSVIIANNICYNAAKDTFNRTRFVDGSSGATGLSSFVMLNNDYYNAGTGTTNYAWSGGTSYSSLSAFATATGQESGSITTDPTITNGGSGGTCSSTSGPQPCPSAYTVSVGSGTIGTGVNLTSAPYSLNVGTRGYFASTIPNGTGTGYNIGAYQGTGVAIALQVLSLTTTTASPNVAWSSTINNKSSGSTITATSSDSTTLTVSGSTVSGTFTAGGTKTITLVETLAGATGSPKTTTATVTVTTGAFMVDNFTATDGTALTSHTADTGGGSWVALPGNAAASPTINSNTLYASASNTSAYYNNTSVPSADYYVEAVINLTTSISGDTVSVIGRASTSADTYYYCRYNQNTTAWQLLRVVAGSNAQIGSTYTDSTFTSGTRTVRLTMTGSTISCSVGGTVRATGTDSNITAAGFPGVRFTLAQTTTTGLHIDNITASQ